MTQLIPQRLRRPAMLLMGAAALAACNGDQAPPPPAAMVPVGDAQFTGTVASRIPTALTVRVNDAQGSPVNGVPVTFTVADGGGTVSKQVDTTRSGGLASTTWTLGERAGAQRVTASAAGLTTVDFTATARAGSPSTIAVNGGNTQTVVVGTASLTPPSVIVKDAFGNPVPGVSIIFTVASGGGTLTNGAALTNAAGIATVGEWRMGTTLGANTLTALALASGVTGNPITFTAQATAGAAARIVPQGSGSISSIVFRNVAPVPQVRVTDASGNPVAGATVTFTGSTGSTVAGGSKTSDASGLASPDAWQLGTTAGTYTLAAAVTGISNATFTASASPDVATTMTVAAGNTQTAQVGRAVPIEPSVKVTDTFGNAVSGVEVLFQVASGGGTAVGRRVTTNSAGIATVGDWTLGDAVGANTLVAAVQTPGLSVNQVTFTATATAGSASTMAVSAGQNQTGPAGAALAVSPAVVVRDARGNPVSGVSVTFTVGSGGGSVTGGTTTTNASGVAAVGAWTLGGAVGTQTLIARSGTLPEVTFTATATAGAAARLTAFSTQDQTSIIAGTALSPSQRPAVRVTDAEGNPVPGITVTFRVATDGSSGSLPNGASAVTAQTNVNGLATVSGWTLPALVGRSTMTASVADVSETVTFSVTTVAGAAAAMTAVSSAIGDVLIGGSITGASLPSVRVTDSQGNPVSGVVVTFAAAAGAGIISPVSPAAITTDASGLATLTSWTVSSTTLGAASVTATAGSLTRTFTANVIASATQTTAATSASSVALSGTATITVTVKDGSGTTITSAGAGAFTAELTGTGTLGAFACTNGVCTATFTAPSTSGGASIAIRVGGTAVSGSPIVITFP
jgi:adhesin/invasin